MEEAADGTERLSIHVGLHDVRSAGGHEGSAARVCALPQEPSQRWLHHAPVLGLCQALRERGERGRTHRARGARSAAGWRGEGGDDHWQTVWADEDFLGKTEKAA